MATEGLTLRTLGRRDARECGDVFSESHHDYPAFVHLLPDPERRRRALRAFFAATARDAAPFRASSGIRDAAGRLLAVAIWLPPGGFPWSAARKARATPAFLRVALASPRSFRTFMATGANAEGAHPTDPHWFLVTLGVRPEAQRRGLGSRLLEPALARADREGVRCYLETSRADNVPYYERFGFHVTDDALGHVPGGPTYWAMSRPSAPVYSGRGCQGRT